jgi:hypothetical protein
MLSDGKDDKDSYYSPVSLEIERVRFLWWSPAVLISWDLSLFPTAVVKPALGTWGKSSSQAVRKPLPVQSAWGLCDLGTQIALWTSLSFSICEEELKLKNERKTQKQQLALGIVRKHIYTYTHIHMYMYTYVLCIHIYAKTSLWTHPQNSRPQPINETSVLPRVL